MCEDSLHILSLVLILLNDIDNRHNWPWSAKKNYDVRCRSSATSRLTPTECLVVVDSVDRSLSNRTTRLMWRSRERKKRTPEIFYGRISSEVDDLIRETHVTCVQILQKYELITVREVK